MRSVERSRDHRSIRRGLELKRANSGKRVLRKQGPISHVGRKQQKQGAEETRTVIALWFSRHRMPRNHGPISHDVSKQQKEGAKETGKFRRRVFILRRS